MKWGVRKKATGGYESYKIESDNLRNAGKTYSSDKKANKIADKLTQKAQKEYDQNVSKNYVNAYNKAADYANSTLIPAINKKYGKYDWTNLDTTDVDNPKGDPQLCKAWKTYINEYDTKFAEALKTSYKDMLGDRPE